MAAHRPDKERGRLANQAASHLGEGRSPPLQCRDATTAIQKAAKAWTFAATAIPIATQSLSDGLRCLGKRCLGMSGLLSRPLSRRSPPEKPTRTPANQALPGAYNGNAAHSPRAGARTGGRVEAPPNARSTLRGPARKHVRPMSAAR